jgi:hypothetical protein
MLDYIPDEQAEIVKVTVHRADGSTEELEGEQFVIAVGNSIEKDEEGNTGRVNGLVEAGIGFLNHTIKVMQRNLNYMMVDSLPEDAKARVQRIIKAIESK